MIKLILVLLIIIGFIWVGSYLYQSYAAHKNQMRVQYDYKKQGDIFEEKASDRVVILLHGFSTGPQEFWKLEPYLKRQNFSYVIPNLKGHNETDLDFLEQFEYEIWEAQLIALYDQLKEKYHHIDVIGFSNGANLAFKLAMVREVDHLIVINPFSYPMPLLKAIHQLAQIKPLYGLLNLLIGYVPLDPDFERPFYQYPYIPFHSLVELLNLQASIDYTALNIQQLDLIFGLKDELSNYPLLVKEKLSPILKDEHILVLQNSGHRALDEDELDQVEKRLDRIFHPFISNFSK